MNIIIVGGGKVGRTIAELLSEGEHNITIVDQNQAILYDVQNNYDVMGVVGNGATYSTLQEAGVDDADIFIAVTNSDELNLLCCQIAQKAANCRTIARVRNPEYYGEIGFIKEKMGISMIINPEYATAIQISKLLHCPSAKNIDTFAGGNVELVEYYLEKDNCMVGLPLYEFNQKIDDDVLVCAVKRGGDVEIPDGSFVLAEDDILSIVTRKESVDDFFLKVGEKARRIHNAVIVGGGTISYYLAKDLLAHRISVKIIEQNKARCEKLCELLPEAVIIHGDATNKSLLREEGVEHCDAFISLTNIDEGNIFLSMYVNKVAKAKVVTKINHIAFDEVIEDLAIGSIVYPKFITAEYIIQYVRATQNAVGSNVEALFRILDSKAEALEFVVKADEKIVGIPLERMNIKKGVLIAGIIRDGRMLLPNGQSTLEIGDHAIVVSTENNFDDLHDILQK